MELTVEEIAMIFHALRDTGNLKPIALANRIKDFVKPAECKFETVFILKVKE